MDKFPNDPPAPPDHVDPIAKFKTPVKLIRDALFLHNELSLVAVISGDCIKERVNVSNLGSQFPVEDNNRVTKPWL